MKSEEAQRILARDEKLFGQGSEFALCDAFLLCFQFKRPIQSWMAKACLERLQLIAQGNEKTILGLMRKNQKLTKHIVRNMVFEELLSQGGGWKRATHKTVKELLRGGIESQPSFDGVKESTMLVRNSKKRATTSLSRKSVRGRPSSSPGKK